MTRLSVQASTVVIWLVLLALVSSHVTGDVLYNGIVYSAGEWSAPGARLANSSSDQSLAAIASTGATHIRLLVTWYQDYVNSTEIYPMNGTSPLRTATDDELLHAMNASRNLGLKVCMAPILDPNWDLLTNRRDYDRYPGAMCVANASAVCPGWPVSRLLIGCAENDPQTLGQKCERFSDTQWTAWFKSYETFVVRYAQLAERGGADLFMVGSELDFTFAEGERWAQIVQSVRAVYSGNLTAAAGMSVAESMTWWDKLDYLGTEGYDPLQPANETVEGLVEAWQPLLERRDTLVKKWGNKSLIFTEHGYQSRPGCWKRPYATIRPYASDCSVWRLCYDVSCQATAYEAFFRAVSSRPWYVGSFWWLWRSDASQGGASDNSFTPHDKPAEQVMMSHFKPAQRKEKPSPARNSRWEPDRENQKLRQRRELLSSVHSRGAVRSGAVTVQRGMVFGSGQWSSPNATLDSVESFQSIQQCALTAGIDTLQFIPTMYYANASSTAIYSKGDDSVLRTTTHAELANTAQFAATLNLNTAITVMLEPDYDLADHYDSNGRYVGEKHQSLGVNFTSAELSTWFAGYKKIVLDYASLADASHIDTLILSHQLTGIMTHNDSAALFHDVIGAVRHVYNGQVTITVDGAAALELWKEGKIPWLKELDFIATSCYWPVLDNETFLPDLPWTLPQVDDLVRAYAGSVASLASLSLGNGNMTVVCTNVGYQSRPYAWHHRVSAVQLDAGDCSVWDQCVNADAQSLAYQAFLQSVYGQPWFGGAHWWLWRSDKTAGGTSDDSYTPAGKPAVDVLREHWL